MLRTALLYVRCCSKSRSNKLLPDDSSALPCSTPLVISQITSFPLEIKADLRLVGKLSMSTMQCNQLTDQQLSTLVTQAASTMRFTQIMHIKRALQHILDHLECGCSTDIQHCNTSVSVAEAPHSNTPPAEAHSALKRKHIHAHICSLHQTMHTG